MPLLDVSRQRRNGAFAPSVFSDPVADVFADLPVEVNESGVDGLKRSLAGALDQMDDLRKGGLWYGVGLVPPLTKDLLGFGFLRHLHPSRFPIISLSNPSVSFSSAR